MNEFTPKGDAMSADNYIMIQPVTTTKWYAQMGFMSNDNPPDPKDALLTDTYDTFEEAISANIKRANETEYGMQIFKEPFQGDLRVDQNTLAKVYMAFQKMHVDRETAIGIVHAIQNEGILFREKA